ncbi:hypothetical protein SUGI_0390350 [Cryptomeria japonica]|nr:hypothetical protein SUGI_0390350 [Cryptomeria japonica]
MGRVEGRVGSVGECRIQMKKPMEEAVMIQMMILILIRPLLPLIVILLGIVVVSFRWSGGLWGCCVGVCVDRVCPESGGVGFGFCFAASSFGLGLYLLERVQFAEVSGSVSIRGEDCLGLGS